MFVSRIFRFSNKKFDYLWPQYMPNIYGTETNRLITYPSAAVNASR